MNNLHSSTELKKILVTGGQGIVASYVKQVFNKADVLLLGKDFLDVSHDSRVGKFLKKSRPDLIIHLAALTNVDLCEKNQALAFKINFEGTKNIALSCKENQIPLVYISSSAVFDGSRKYFIEKDLPRPVNFYGKTKLLSEQVIQENLKNYLIIRAGWMIGGAKKEKKFISYIVEKVRNGESIYAVDDKFGTITYAKDLLLFVKNLISKKEFGLYHFGCDGVCSRFDIANVIKNVVNKKARIIPVSSELFKKKFPAPRPRREVLKSVKYPFIKPWKEVLMKYIKSEVI